MDAVFEISIYVLQFAVAGGVMLLGLKILKKQKIKSIKSKILHLQAHLSKTRMALRTKVQRKSTILRSAFKSPIHAGDRVDTALKKLTENNFETGFDFQNYFEVSREIVSIVNSDPKSKPNPNDNPAALENDFMCKDFKIEMDIIRIIKELSDFSEGLNEKIESFNFKFPNYALEKVDPLHFTAMVDVNRVFKTDTSSSQKTTKRAA